MNLIDAYRYLDALAQHRHFGRAAAACHITQPALSNALRALEEHFGLAIVRRGRVYEGLTAEGEQVLTTARRVLHEQELLGQALAGTREQPRGRLLLGTVPTALPVAARFAAQLVERHPGLMPQLRSMSSDDIEQGLDSLSLDMALGYTDRVARQPRVQTWPQYVEHYYLVQRRLARGGSRSRPIGAPMAWRDAAAMPLCLLTPEMHNRVLLEGVFRELSLQVKPALETDSVMALVVAVQSGGLAAVLPGALADTVIGQPGLQARPLVKPDLRTPIGFMTAAGTRPSQALQAALALAQDAAWQAHAQAHSGPLDH